MTDALDQLRATLRARPAGDEWRPMYQAALADSYRASDIATLARLAGLAGAYLAAEGRTEEAIEEFRFAGRLAEGDPSTAATLLRMRSGHELLGLEPAIALGTLAEARELSARDETQSHVDHGSYVSIARCVNLESATPEDLIAPLIRAERAGMSWLSSGALTWLIPWLFATGRRAEALPWIDAAIAGSRDIGNRWRVEESAVFELAASAPEGAAVGHPRSGWSSAHSYIAIWWQSALATYSARMSAPGDLKHILAIRAEIESIVPPGLRTTSSGLPAIVALVGHQPHVEDDPPDHLSAINLAGALMYAEAAAEAGTQRSAAVWLRWMDERVPPHVETSMEWPVSVDRLRALLTARSGSLRPAVGLMRRALKWAQAKGYVVEEAVASLQLAELLVLAPGLATRGEWRELRERGRQRCADLGIDGARIAEQARSAAALGRFDFERPQLTARESEVLSLLAEGQTYREAAEGLGIDWRTVQTHAHHAYQKLGVSGKIAAISAARELGLI